MTYDTVFVDWSGRTSRRDFAVPLLLLAAVFAFYHRFAAPSVSYWILLTLLFPAFVLHARRLHDLGWSAWLLLIPGALLAAALRLPAATVGGTAQTAVVWAAGAACCGFALWGAVAKGDAGANRYGGPTGP